MLKIKNLKVGYGNVPVIFDFSCEVNNGEVVSILGSNGAGKSTLIKTISGLLRPTSGEITFMGERIDSLPAYKILEKGIAQVPEGRQVFGKMTIKDNLLLGAYVIRDESKKQQLLKDIYELFPRLEERAMQKAETLSGGEQQMLAIARGLMSDPKILMIDEMSLGLAPVLVEKVMDTLEVIKERVTVLLVEQKVQEALEIADRGYVLQNGRLAVEGSGKELLESDIVKKAYLGL